MPRPEYLGDAQDYIRRLEAVIDIYDAAADKFIYKVERGMARSTETYNDLNRCRAESRKVLRGRGRV